MYKCQGIQYPVVGWSYGTAITFTVEWRSAQESCNSLTAWTGFLYGGKIYTLWQLVNNQSVSIDQIVKGADTFTFTGAVEYDSIVTDAVPRKE